jgi:surface antigen
MKRMALVATVLMGTLVGTAAAFGQVSGDLPLPEQQAMSDTVQYALENNKSNESSDWMSPDTGNSGGVTPVRTFADAQGQPCREFISTIVIGGRQEQGYGTACRQPDGTWQIVPNESSVVRDPPQATQTYIYVNNPPPAYYYYPYDFYSPYHIYLSFGYVYRGGFIFRGTYFLDGRDFRHRYPIRIHERRFFTPHDRAHYHRMRNWWEYRGRKGVHPGHEGRRERWERREWQDRDREERWRGRGR